MPAAAVIPAPRAYTIIAAVKTPVVCHWVAGLLGGRPRASRAWTETGAGGRPPPLRTSVGVPWGFLRVLGYNPQRYAPAPVLFCHAASICSC